MGTPIRGCPWGLFIASPPNRNNLRFKSIIWLTVQSSICYFCEMNFRIRVVEVRRWCCDWLHSMQPLTGSVFVLLGEIACRFQRQIWSRAPWYLTHRHCILSCSIIKCEWYLPLGASSDSCCEHPAIKCVIARTEEWFKGARCGQLFDHAIDW